MPSSQPPTASEEITPQEFFEVIGLGTGCDFSHRRLIDFIKKHRERAREILEQANQYITKSTGFTPTELTALTPEGIFPKSDRYREARTSTKKQLLATTPFLKRYGEDSKESGLRRTGREANAYIKAQSNYYFPGEDSLETHPKVETCNEAEYLVMMAFNDNADPKIKFQAALKLLLMKYIGEIRNYSKKDENHDLALQFMNEIIDERIVQLPEDSKMGATTPRYLISFHDAEQNYATVGTKIMDKNPDEEDLQENAKVTHLESQKATIIDKNGEKRTVYFTMRFREKADESRLIKALRYGAKVGEKDVDRNGVEFVFENIEDWRDFFPIWLGNVKNKIREDLLKELEKTEVKGKETIALDVRKAARAVIYAFRKYGAKIPILNHTPEKTEAMPKTLEVEKTENWRDTIGIWLGNIKNKIFENVLNKTEEENNSKEKETLRERLAKIDDCIEISEEKDTLEGGEFNGSDISSSKNLKVHKFKLRIIRADGRWHFYEIRAFLPDGYADTMYRKGVSWEEYHVDRFFLVQVDQLFFPEHIYPGIDRQKTHEKALERAHKKVWGNHHSASIAPPPNKESERYDDEK